MSTWEDLLDRGAVALEAECPEQALSFFKRALLQTQEWSPNGPEAARCEVALAEALLRLERLPEAEAALVGAVESYRRLAGEDAPELLAARRLLAGCRTRQERYAEAVDAFERLLEQEERCFGPNHPTVASSLLGLAECHLTLREELRAETLLRRCLAVRSLAFGPDHVETLVPRIHLAALLERQGRAEDVASLGPLPVDQVKAPASPVLVRSLRLLGHAWVQRGELVLARPLLERVADLYQAMLPVEHPLCAESLRDLGVLLLRLGEFSRAEGPLSYSLAQAERRLGPMHPQVARLCSWLGQVKAGLSKYPEAMPLLQRALQVVAQVQGTAHPEYAEVLQAIGSLHFTQSNLRWAERFFRHALSTMELSIGLARRRTLKVVMDLAGCLRLQGRGAEARRLFEQVVVRIRQRHGATHPLIPAYARAYMSVEKGAFPLAA